MKQLLRLGVFDSGVGGLSVLQELRSLPIAEFVYCADTANLPYGEKTPEHITALTSRMVTYLIEQQVDAIVIACHTASAIALDTVRTQYPQIPIIGVVDPVVAQALQITKTGRIGVMGTPATIASAIHQKKILERNPSATVVMQACPLLVPLIEQGQSDTPELHRAVQEYVGPLVAQGIDTLIIGCTHYELIKPVLAAHAPGISLISAPRETTRALQRIMEQDFMAVGKPKDAVTTYHVSGSVEQFQHNARQLLGWDVQELRKVPER